MNVSETIYSIEFQDMTRDNLDSFLKKVSFHYDIPSIHVAGTNGKSVVSSMLSNIYRSSGRKVGLFISSNYKRDICEMIQINGLPISNSELEAYYNENQKLFKKYELSPFDIITFIALSYFQKENVDVAIIECGMGGEYDSTNIFIPILSIITNVSLEHTEYLGVSLSEIALHKAGIIKNNIPTLIGEISGDALDVIVDVAKRKGSKITRIVETHNVNYTENGISFDYKTYRDLEISNFGNINVKNACLAIDVIDLLMENLPVDENALKDGLKDKLPKGKFEVIQGDPLFIIDGAHNPDAINKLRNDVELLGLEKEVFVIFATFKDKNITSMLPEIGLLGKVYLTTFNNKRARDEFEYFLFLNEYEYNSDYKAIIESIKVEHPDSAIVIAGSNVFASIVSDEYNK